MGLFQTVKAYQNTTVPNTSQTDGARSARRFGTWTLLSGIIRLYAVYNIHNNALYVLALWTYVIAGAHFAAEKVFFGDRLNVGALSVASVSTGWMLAQWSFYVKV